MIRTYSEMCAFDSFGERLKYLQLFDEKHISPRQVSNSFYKSSAWKQVRQLVIQRDYGSDLGIINLPIEGEILVHHMNPLEQKDLDYFNDDKLLNPEYLVCVSLDTHGKIHYSSRELKLSPIRKPGDTDLF